MTAPSQQAVGCIEHIHHRGICNCNLLVASTFCFDLQLRRLFTIFQSFCVFVVWWFYNAAAAGIWWWRQAMLRQTLFSQQQQFQGADICLYEHCCVLQCLTLSVGQQEGHPPGKIECWCVTDGDLIGAFHVVEFQLSPPPPSSLQQNLEWFDILLLAYLVVMETGR